MKKKNNFSSQLLIPDGALAEKLRTDYIPRLIKIIGQEGKIELYSTLKELLVFLSYYKYLHFNLNEEASR